MPYLIIKVIRKEEVEFFKEASMAEVNNCFEGLVIEYLKKKYLAGKHVRRSAISSKKIEKIKKFFQLFEKGNFIVEEMP